MSSCKVLPVNMAIIPTNRGTASRRGLVRLSRGRLAQPPVSQRLAPGSRLVRCGAVTCGILPVIRCAFCQSRARLAFSLPGIILVLWPGQPSPLQTHASCLAAVGLEAIALTRSASVIRKKKFLAVQALPARLARLHWSQSQKEPEEEKQGTRGRKSSRRKIKRRRRNKNFQRIFRRKSTGIRSILNRRF